MLEVGEGASCFIIDGGAKASWLIISVAIARSAGVVSFVSK